MQKIAAPTLPVRICRWYDDKQAAVSLRFDDSHPTHLSVALPLLNERKFVGTFLVNPGTDRYLQHKNEWEGVVLENGHELGNHTLNHRGARTDDEADQEIGEAARLLHQLQPKRNLIAFEPGGGTLWEQRKPFSFFIAKYGLYDIHAAKQRQHYTMSCSEVHSLFNVKSFKDNLSEAIASGAWFQPHFHEIDTTGSLRISPAMFKELLDIVAGQREIIWQAGLTEIGEYEEERDNARIWSHRSGDNELTIELASATDPSVYTQPLTLAVDLPPGMTTARVTTSAGAPVPARIINHEKHQSLLFDAPAIDGSFIVHATNIGNSYQNSSDPANYNCGTHPYLFFDSEEIKRVLEKTLDPKINTEWQGLFYNAKDLAKGDAVTNTSPGSSAYGRARVEIIRRLCFVYSVTHDGTYVPRVLREIEQILSEDAWHLDRADAWMTALTLGALGTAYDQMYDVIPQDLRLRIRQAILTYGIEAVNRSIEEEKFWTSWYRCNWGAVIYSQIGLAALSIMNEEPQAVAFVRLAIRKAWHYTMALDSNGGWGESASYGVFAWSNLVTFMDAIQHVSDGKENLFDNPRLRLLPYWFLDTQQPDMKSFVPFSDCTVSSLPPSFLYRFARAFRDENIQWLANSLVSQSPCHLNELGLLWYDPTLIASDLSKRAVTSFYPDLSWAFFRGSWQNNETTLFAFKGGQQDWDHSHHDGNSFVLYAYGEPLLIDTYYPRTNYWALRAESHNTVTVEGQDQRGKLFIAGLHGKPDHRTVMGGLVQAPWYARIVGDASLAYDQNNVSSYVREALYLRKLNTQDPPDYLVFFDDLSTPVPAKATWWFHTYGKISDGGNHFTITQNDVAADLTFITPNRLTGTISFLNIEEAGVDHPRNCDGINTLALEQAQPEKKSYLVSVIIPTWGNSPSEMKVVPIQDHNILGATIQWGQTTDLATFALADPSITTAGITALGRSCFVRKQGSLVTKAALQQGKKLVAYGRLLFESDTSGNITSSWSDGMIDVGLELYNPTWIRIYAPAIPTHVLVDDEEVPFEYTDQEHYVMLSVTRKTRKVQIEHPSRY
jgi:hypothetical protein